MHLDELADIGQLCRLLVRLEDKEGTMPASLSWV